MPTEFLSTVRVSRQSFLNSLERATILAKETRNIVKLDIKENYVYVSAASESGNVNESVIANLEGKDVSIAFNAKFLLDALKGTGDEYINIYLNGSISPCVIRPYSGDEYIYLILPIRIAN